MDTYPTPFIYRPFAFTTGAWAVLYALATFCIAVYFMVGFHENDPQLSAFLPAIALCLCLSAVFIVPALITARLASKILKGTVKRSSAFWAIVFNIPILILSVFIFVTASLPPSIALVIFCSTFIFLGFASYAKRACKARVE